MEGEMFGGAGGGVSRGCDLVGVLVAGLHLHEEHGEGGQRARQLAGQRAWDPHRRAVRPGQCVLGCRPEQAAHSHI